MACRRHHYVAATSAIALGTAAASAAPGGRQQVDISGGRLSAALSEFARETGTELLFNQSLVSGLNARPLRARVTARVALTRILDGTGLAYREVGGSFVLFRARAKRDGPATTRTALPAVGAVTTDLHVPEILVIGRRTQNTDIRRTLNDIQPYSVATGSEILRAHTDNLGQYFDSRVPMNTQVLSPSRLNNGEAVSEIDIRGLGADATLILLDGRRLPSIPASSEALSFRQSDLNAIPLHAVDRVETLTGTAGGIYGFGALGGVINVITKRQYRGVEVHGSLGVTSRGGARQSGVEGRLGFTPDGGSTDVMVYLSHKISKPLLDGQRDYRARERREVYRRFPDLFERANFFEFGNSLGIINRDSPKELVFKADYGGNSLGASRTYLPLGFTGERSALVTFLAENAGQIDLTSAPPEARSHIGSHASTSAAILNVRRSLGRGYEAFFDGVFLRNEGQWSAPGQRLSVTLAPGSTINPFNNHVEVVFPALRGGVRRRSEFVSLRYTGGILVPLPHRWRASAEVTFGLADYASTAAFDGYSPPLGSMVNPFGSWDDLQGLLTRRVTSLRTARIRNRYQERLIRLGGPLIKLAGGEAALTLLVEDRDERVPEHAGLEKTETAIEPARYIGADWRAQTRAYYGELKIPVTGTSSSLLSNLEIQLAVRNQGLAAAFWTRAAGVAPLDRGPRVNRAFRSTSYTAGAKAKPQPWLMLRASYATGRLPPPLVSLISFEDISNFQCFKDPKRGDQASCITSGVLVKLGGSPDLKMSRANTLSLGAVLTPFGDQGLRISLDYSRVRRTGDPYALERAQVLAFEDKWPERVVRMPLSEADRARGYTGGQITTFDGRATNGKSRTVEALDARIDWPTQALWGQLRPYAAATLQIRNATKSLFEPELETVGFRTGPLRWRANGGVDWTDGRTSIGANLQYFSSYRIIAADPVARLREPTVPMFQGGARVSSQAYVDVYASRDLHLKTGRNNDRLKVSLGVSNLLDTAPPFETRRAGGYGVSRYGDPRGRRFDLSVSATF